MFNQANQQRPFSMNSASMIPGPPGFNHPLGMAEQQRFQNTQASHFENQNQGYQGTPVPPSAQFGQNLLRSMAIMTGDHPQPNAPFPPGNNLHTSIVTQHFSNDPMQPGQMPFMGYDNPPPAFPPSNIGPYGMQGTSPMIQSTSSYPNQMPPPRSTMFADPLQPTYNTNISISPPQIQSVTTTEVRYGSNHLNQIAEQIHQSQIRSSRMQGQGSAMLNSIRRSNVAMPFASPTSVITPPPVDDLERQRIAEAGRKCPCWLYVLLAVLIALALLAVLGWLKMKYWNGNDACPSGSYKYGSKCLMCPSGTKWNGKECLGDGSTSSLDEDSTLGVDTPVYEDATKEGECRKGLVKHGERCVKCPKTSTWNGTHCSINMHFPPEVAPEEPVAVPKPPKREPVASHPPVVEPLKKDPIQKKTVPKQDSSKQNLCQPDYVYYRNGCIPLIAHQTRSRHLKHSLTSDGRAF